MQSAANGVIHSFVGPDHKVINVWLHLQFRGSPESLELTDHSPDLDAA
jgi:hypothetical protein